MALAPRGSVRLAVLLACAAGCTATAAPDGGGSFPPGDGDADADADADGDGDADADADADGDGDADADSDGDADVPQEVGCGNGACEEGEDGAHCPSDCCDEDTPCDATWQDAGDWYCRAMNGGDYWWWSAEDTTEMCDEESELGTGTYECDGTSGTCCALGGGWREGDCR